MDKNKRFKQLSGLKQNKGKTPEEIMKQVDLEAELIELADSFVGLKAEETPKAIVLYQKYMTENSFETLAEKTMLINLIRDELIKERIAKQIQDDHDNKSINSLHLIEGLREIEDHILNQKEKLGMLKDKNSESAFDLFNELKEKCLKYYEEHAAEFQQKCPYCGEIFPSILPPDKLDSAPSTWFKNTTFYNYEVFDAYHNKEIDKLRAAKILGVHSNYIDKMYNEIYLKEKNDNKS